MKKMTPTLIIVKIFQIREKLLKATRKIHDMQKNKDMWHEEQRSTCGMVPFCVKFQKMQTTVW